MKKIKLLMLFVCMMMEVGTTTAQVLEQDSLTLVAFYNSTGGPNWTNNNHWLTGPVSTWYGVTLTNNRIKKIILNSNNLVGTLPPELGQLNVLVTIALSNDTGLTGEIPIELFQIDSLKQIGIGNCSLTGIIPSSIGNCSFLTELNLPQNNLTGPIPPEIGNLGSLKFLDLHDNQLSGTIPLELGNCTNLLELWLNNNFLTGALPTELANLNEVYYFDVSFNKLEGDIPDELARVISYMDLFFNDNNFTGIPPWDNNWILNSLGLQNNKMTFEDIEPHFVGYMWFNYAPQDSMGVKIDTALVPGSSFNIYSGTEGEFTEYFWYRNNELILQSMEADTLFLEEISNADTGKYWCMAKNSLATELTLARRPVHITIDTGTNIANISNIQKYITIYPNPAGEEFTVVMSFESEPVTLRIFDAEGHCVLTERYIQSNSSQIVVSIQGLIPGVYFLQAQNENSNYTTKLMINNRGTDR